MTKAQSGGLKLVISCVCVILAVMGIVFAAGGQNAKIEANTTKVEEHKDDTKAGFIVLHKRLNAHEKEQKRDFDEVKRLLYSIHAKVK